MLKYIVFYRQFITRKISQLSRILDTQDIKQLPNLSIYHDISNINTDREYKNINRTEISPHINEKDPFFNMLPKKKLIFNVTSYQQNGLIPPPSNMKIITIGLNQQLKEFKSQNLGKVFYTNSMEELHPTNLLGGYVNYNPFFNNKIKGIGKELTFHKFLLGSILNNIAVSRDYKHYIRIPLSEVPYDKTSFLRTADKITLQTIHDVRNPSYLMLMDFYNFVNVKATTSMFNLLDDDLLANTHIIFTRKDKFIIYNLKELKTMNTDSNTIYIKLFNHINSLIKYQEPEIEEVDEVATTVTNIDIKLDNNVTGTSTPKSVESIAKHRVEQTKETTKAMISTLENDKELSVKQKAFIVDKVKKIDNLNIETPEGAITVGKLLSKDVDISIKTDILNNIPNVSDKSMLASTITEFDKEYLKKLYYADMLKVLKSFSKNGMYLIDLKAVDVSDKLNHLITYTAIFLDKEGKKHTIKYTLPKIDKDGNCLLSGNKRSMLKQRINTPIVKVSPTRVTLNSNFNKTMVERNTNVVSNFSSYLSNYIKKNNSLFRTEIGNKLDNTVRVSNHYSLTAIKFKSILVDKKLNLFFDYDNRYDNIKIDKKKIVDVESEYNATYLGYSGSTQYYIALDGEIITGSGDKGQPSGMTLLDLISQYSGVALKPFNEYTELLLFNKKIPVVMVLAYRFGLQHVLKYLKVKYKLYEPTERVPDRNSKLIVKFSDKQLVIDKLPMSSLLIMSGLNKFKLNGISYTDMEDKNIYYDILNSKGISLQYIKLIDDFYDYFVDPITEEILFEMNEPTTFKDLIIRCTTLLTTSDHLEAASAINFRFRSYERHAALIYSVLAKELSAHNRSTGNTRFSISEFTIKQKAIQDPLLNNVSTINPIEDIKTRLNYTHIGDGGRSDQTMMVDDRNYTTDNIGIMSDVSVDSGKVGVSAQLSMNSTLRNLRGMPDIDKDGGTNSLLSVSTMLAPGATQDDKLNI